MYDELLGQWVERGYAGPVRVLEEPACRQIADRLSDGEREPADWHKGHAAASWAFYRIAKNPAIIERVSSLLGDDVMLWGASLQTRAPGAIHPWHSDIEISTVSGKSASVWIGLEHTEADSSLLLMPYSHRFGVSVQETAHRFGKRRRDIDDENVSRWAAQHDPRSGIVKLDMTDGEALFFDGVLWHGSHNRTGNTRRALLLQYATPDVSIRIPDMKRLEWPFRLIDSPRPPCLMMKGTARGSDNRIVTPPRAPQTDAVRKLANRVYPLRVPLASDEEKGWKPYPIFRGSTKAVGTLTCHASALTHGQCPHPPHRHDEEEILLVLSGEVDISVPDLDSRQQDGRLRIKPGQFAYYPANFAHTLRTVSKEPANYLMFKWRGMREGGTPLGFGCFDALGTVVASGNGKGFRTQALFEGTTTWLRKLHSHASALQPGAGYMPHVDAHDVAIVVLEGEVETLGERVKPCSVIFYSAGESHGMSNPGISMARYLVIEFHGDGIPDHETNARRAFHSSHRSVGSQRWRKIAKEVLKRIGSYGE